MKRLLLIFAFIAVQIVLSLSIGYMALSVAAPSSIVRDGAYFTGADYTGASPSNAVETIAEIDKARIEKGIACFSYQGTEFLFHFKEVGLYADYADIEAALSQKKLTDYYHNLFSAFTRSYGTSMKAAYNADIDSFREKLRLMKEFIDQDPVNADISISRRGDIVKTPAENGAYFDVDENADRLFASFLSDPFSPIEIDSDAATSPVTVLEPRVTDWMLDDIDAVLASISASIPNDCDAWLIESVFNSIDKVWIPKKGMAFAPFSFLRYISDAGLQTDNPSREYDFAASMLFHALLASGVDYAQIEPLLTHDEQSYSGLPGFSVEVISAGATPVDAKGIYGGSKPDFKFTNTLDGNIIVFATVTYGSLKIIIAGNSKFTGNGAAPYEVRSEIADRRKTLYRNEVKITEYDF
jgi:hypothetical protein